MGRTVSGIFGFVLMAATSGHLIGVTEATEHTEEWIEKAVISFDTYCFQTGADFDSTVSIVKRHNLPRTPTPELPSSVDRRDPAVALVESTKIYIAHQKANPETYVLVGITPGGMCAVTLIGTTPLQPVGERLNAAVQSQFNITLLRQSSAAGETEFIYVLGHLDGTVDDISNHQLVRITFPNRKSPVNTATVAFMDGPLFATHFKW